MKIYLVNPTYSLRCAELLRSGKIWNTPIQPYESHIPHILQFFTDFNLYGCGWVRLSNARFRPEVPPEYVSESEGRVLSGFSFPRMSYSELEIDVLAEEIENRLELQERSIHHDFIERNLSIPAGFKFVSSMKALWDEDWERRQTFGESLYQEPPPHPRIGAGRKWNKQDEYSTHLKQSISASLGELYKAKKHFDHFVTNPPYLENVPTCFESVKTMFKGDVKRLENGLDEPPTELSTDMPQEIVGDDIHGREADDNASVSTNDDSDNMDENAIETEQMEKSPAIGLKRITSMRSPAKRQKTSNGSMRKGPSHLSPSFHSSFLKSLRSMRSPDLTSLSSQGLGKLDKISKTFSLRSPLMGPRVFPPSTAEVMSTFEEYNLPNMQYTEPYFSKPEDVPVGVFLHAGVEYTLKGHRAADLEPFNFLLPPNSPADNPQTRAVLWEYGSPPPSQMEVRKWLDQLKRGPLTDSQTAENSQNGDHSISSYTHVRYMSLLAIEIHTNCKEGKFPNPNTDEAAAVFWKFHSDFTDSCFSSGIIALGDLVLHKNLDAISGNIAVQVVETEVELLDTLVRIVRYHDPDVLTGYEIHKASWGYLVDRSRIAYDRNLSSDLSRVMDKNVGRAGDKWGYTHASAFQVIGRHMLNIWRVLRHEQDDLLGYTMENVVFDALKKRIPKYSFDVLTGWFRSGLTSDLKKWFNYIFSRVCYDLDIVHHYELIGRNSEQAKMIGIDFYSVMSRGSQFKVESLLTRIVKTESFVMFSPNRKQVGQQNALEYIPLVMEPMSGYYTSPVLVLDFQSLYPSVMIAYNYCYSTCLGRAIKFKGRNKLGVLSELELDPGALGLLKDYITVAPNGLLYVKQDIRRSTLSKMLAELLSTRMMVKDSMKRHKNDVLYQKCMNNRQLALKLTANVTYGYTSATYSGRMPCAEIADSIVLSGREILERAIETIRNTEKWGAEVVYGDTDSIFVHLPGKTKEQAFQIGKDIATTITSVNPEPIKLKFEKLYLPCVLLTKKRYVGYSYENVNQKVPTFDAKGTETVRRDGTPAEQRIEETCLRILFETNDLSKVKGYLFTEWTNLMTGNVNVMDFCFNKEVRMGSYKEGGTLPPGANISAKRMRDDERQEPQYRERVRYVVISGPPGSRLVDRCVPPEDLLNNSYSHLDADYYITKNIIPPLERIFNILGADIKSWYESMPKIYRFQPISEAGKRQGDKSLRHYMKTSTCAVCRKSIASPGVCDECAQSKSKSVFIMEERMKGLEKRLLGLESICRNCASLDPQSKVQCTSQDCPIYYSRVAARVRLHDCVEVEKTYLMKALDW